MEGVLAWLTGGSGDLLDWSEGTVKSVLGGVSLAHLTNIALFVASFIGLALIAWTVFYRPEERRGGGGRLGLPGRFLAFLFPRAVYLHRSSRVDLGLIVVNQIASPVSIFIAVLLGGVLAAGTSAALTAVTGWNPGLNGGWAELAGLTLCLALAADLGTYITHRLCHTVPWLWEFHKVHHSAEVLSPLTVFRKHPVFDLMSRTMKALLVGPLLGVVFWAFAGPVELPAALGANVVYAAFHLSGAGLRHSHVWLSWGRRLEHVLISPAQHQIHHSKARRHWDRNFGQVFAVWDWMFGTLYVPQRREELEFGLDDTPSVRHAGVVGGCLTPFRNAWAVFRRRRARSAGPVSRP